MKINDINTKIKISHIRFCSPITFVSLLLFIFPIITVLFLKTNYTYKSDIIIRIAAAGILNIDPNDLTDEDFKKITTLNLDGMELKDISLLRKFTNLEELYLANVHFPKTKKNRWMDILIKLHVLDPAKRNLIDLNPLQKLSNLRIVTLIGSPVKSIKPLAKLKNLEYLNLNETQVSDIKPVKNLMNLQGLYLSGTLVSDIEPVRNLTKLKSLYLENTKVNNLEPVVNLTNLMQLRLKNTPVTDLKPLCKLENLQKLYIENCRNIKTNEIANLRNNLPNLYISTTNQVPPEITQSNPDITNIPNQPAQNFSGLIHYWSFDENQGDIFYDSVSGKNGQIFGAKWTNGISGSALIFDGKDDYATLPDNNSIWLPENNFTISVWVSLNVFMTSNNMVLDLNYSRTNETGYNILYTKNKPVFQLHTKSKVNEDLYSELSIRLNKWYHICTVRNESIQAIYINGQLYASRECSSEPIRFVDDYDDNKVNIGRYTTVLAQPRYFLNGKIDELKIYNRALSTDEIEQIYNAEF